MSTTTIKSREPRWYDYTEVEADRPVSIMYRSATFDLIHLPAHGRRGGGTWRVRYRSTGQNFGTVAVVESPAYKRLHVTEPRGYGSTEACRRDAVRWILDHPWSR